MRILLPLALAGAPAFAAPNVATDIAPVHSLVARVMDGVGTPTLILPQSASAHGHAMAPSEARVLAEADLLVWIGPALTPWLEDAAESLAPDVPKLILFEAKEDGRDGEDHADHDDHDHGDDHGDRGADGHAADDHAGEEGHDDHAGHDHAHGEDPHVWLDPIAAAGLMEMAAGALSEIDPGNAALYAANAAEGRAEMEALVARIDGTLGTPRFVVSHDAYGHFEDRFGVSAMAALADSEDAPPGAARVRAVRDSMDGAACVFVENASESVDLAEMLGGEVGARLVEVDPLGASYETGTGLYPALIEGIAEAMRGCGG